MALDESIVEDAALTWFGELGYAVGHGPQMAPGEPAGERDSFGEVVLAGRLREALRQLNPAIPEEAREDALRKVLRVATPSLVRTNRAFHKLLRDGVDVEYARPDGSTKHDKAWLVEFSDVRANDWLAVNQFTVIEGQHNRRPDIVVFVNGLPLGLIELKNAADESATIWSAYAQLQTYKAEIPSLLAYNAALVVSDGLQARMGSLTANQEWFKVWREHDAPPTGLELEILIRGVFDRGRFLQLLQHFMAFEESPDTGAIQKIIAGYHQFHAVNAAVEETVRASGMTVESSVLREEPPGRHWAGKMHGGKLGDISIYGQDKWARRQRPFGLAKRARRVRLRGKQPKQSNATTRRLAIMNLAIRGIEADFGPEHADTFRRDLHPDLRADTATRVSANSRPRSHSAGLLRSERQLLANPPFNDSDTALRGSAFLQSEAKPQVVSEAKDNFRKDDDVRWQFGVGPALKSIP